MDSRWNVHNSHQDSGASWEDFEKNDPQLRNLAGLSLRFRSEIIDRIPIQEPGIFMLGGGRQVGKSTLVKQLMANRLRAGIPNYQIHYISCELIQDAEDLRLSLTELAEATPAPGTLIHLFVDEVTYVEDWDLTIKYLADAGVLERTNLLLTGSDMVMMEEGLMRLPGRRGRSDRVDFHLRPLSFHDFCTLRGRLDRQKLEEIARGTLLSPTPEVEQQFLQRLENEFRIYHLSGGYLTAMNDLESNGAIAKSTLRTYSSWIRGDVLKKHKTENYLREVLHAILRRYNSQVTWNSLAKELPIDHPNTIANYCNLLERMDAATLVSAIREDTLSAAPKKAKKIYFNDPFIYHALNAYINDAGTPTLESALTDDKLISTLGESSLIGHLRRRFPTFYIKAEGEVDAAYVDKGKFFPIEFKWTGQLRPKDLKQVRKYDNALIAARVLSDGKILGIPVRPAPVILLRSSYSQGTMATNDEP